MAIVNRFYVCVQPSRLLLEIVIFSDYIFLYIYIYDSSSHGAGE